MPSTALVHHSNSSLSNEIKRSKKVLVDQQNNLYISRGICRRSNRVSTSRLQAPAYPRKARRGILLCQAGVGLFFSTSTGHTEDVAGLIKEVGQYLLPCTAWMQPSQRRISYLSLAFSHKFLEGNYKLSACQFAATAGHPS